MDKHDADPIGDHPWMIADNMTLLRKVGPTYWQVFNDLTGEWEWEDIQAQVVVPTVAKPPSRPKNPAKSRHKVEMEGQQSLF